MSEREKRRRRVSWLLDLGEVAFVGGLSALGVGLTGGPDWAVFGVAWLSGLVTRAEQRATNPPTRPASSRPTQDGPQ